MATVNPIVHDSLTDTLKKELEQRELEIALLREISELVGSEFDLQKVLDRVARRARELIQAETVLIPILNSGRYAYTYQAADGLNADELLNETLPIEIGICGWVLRNRRPWWQGTLDELSESERTRWEKDAGTLILIPLMGRNRFLGGIACLNKIGTKEFNQRDMELLSMFAGQVSVAIENAMMVSNLNAMNVKTEVLKTELEQSNKKLIESNLELQHLAVHDPLTVLPNRTLIMDRLEQGIRAASRDGEKLALIMIDLDRFKEVNDTLGHLVGDQLLCGIADRFRCALREVDTLGRLGGDEFAVVVAEADLKASIVVVEKLQSTLRTPIEINGTNISVGASMGIALYPDHGDSPDSLLRFADIAMYVAKRNDNEFCVYNEQYDDHNSNHLTLVGDLRAAIQNQDIDIALQPKLDITTKQIIGIEALARWTRPGENPMGPNEFIPVLESTGLIKEFTLQILEKSIKACADCRAEGFSMSVAVNLSVHNLRDPLFPDQVAELLDRYRMDENTLMLEISERVIMDDPSMALDVLTRLNELKVRISIDDFGTGYSSLIYLKKLPIHQLKIDPSLVSRVTTDPDDAIIVQSTISLAHSLGLTVVAEGVEEQDVLRTIQNLGCDSVQGYLVSRPLDAESFVDFLKTTPWPVRKLSNNSL